MQALSQLPAKLEANIMRTAMRAGARVVAQEAKARVPVQAGDLKRSIKVKTRRTRKGRVTAVLSAGDDKAFYAHMIEFGTNPHEIKPWKGKGLLINGKYVKKVNHPGIRPKPFMRPALDAKHQEALLAVGEQVRKRLTKEGLNAPDNVMIED